MSICPNTASRLCTDQRQSMGTVWETMSPPGTTISWTDAGCWTVAPAARLPPAPPALGRPAGSRTGQDSHYRPLQQTLPTTCTKGKLGRMIEHLKPLEINICQIILHRYLDVPARTFKIKSRLKSLMEMGHPLIVIPGLSNTLIGHKQIT